MPRKQRFKPSRKPKPAQPSEVSEVSNQVDPSSEPTRPYRDDPEPMRSPQDTSAVIEASAQTERA
jgi:hypothetical protein